MPGDNIARKHHVVVAIDEILTTAQSLQWGMCMHNNQVYVFNGSYWALISEKKMKNFLGKAAELLGVPRVDAKHFAFREDLYKQFVVSSYLPLTKKQGDEVLINLQNGTFSITPTAQMLRGFQREDFITYQLPFKYDGTAVAPIFDQYLREVLPDVSQQQVLAEFVAYVFVKRQTLKLEKSLILYGTGANGKSVFFEILMALLGKENVSNVGLQDLTEEKGYYRAELGTKLLNYASEISAKMNSIVFKQLVSGEPVITRLPCKPPVTIDDYAKLIFNTNELPKDVENNEAFFRRFLIIKFGVTIPEQNRDPQLATRIIQNELSGVFNWVLAGLNRLLTQGNFTYSKGIEEAVDAYRQESDTVNQFITDEALVPSVVSFMPLKYLYVVYKKHCQDLNYKPSSVKSFAEKLRSRGMQFDRKNIGNVVYIEKKVA